MAAAAHHPNVKLLVYSEVDKIEKQTDGTFLVKLHKKPTFVDQSCTGCSKCEIACTVAITDEYNYGLVGRRAAHIAFPQAVPKKAVIDRDGSPPCLYTCPAGVKPSGFVSLVRAGKHDEAFRLHLEEAPLVGSLSRACYAPCEGECSRGSFEGPVHIRAIKRFMVDRYYETHHEPEYGAAKIIHDKKVAVIGSGPAGLTAAFHLAKKGYPVTVFESQKETGGMLRYGMPAFRMPHDLLDRDIRNITALGVEVRTESPVNSISELKEQGFDAVFVGVGGQIPKIIPLAGQEHIETGDCMFFLYQAKMEEPQDIAGKHVVVIGGGNVAMDVSRSAVRMGAAKVSVLCLEDRESMPAHDFEIVDAVAEGVELYPGTAVNMILPGTDGQSILEFAEVEELAFSEGKADIRLREGSERRIPADLAVLSVGLAPSTEPFAGELALNKDRTIRVDQDTCETSLPGVFSGGDATLGPSIIVKAMGTGKRAAFFIDRYLQGDELEAGAFEPLLPMIDKEELVRQSANITHREPVSIQMKPALERIQSFESFEETLTEEQARNEANRCLNCGGCSQCLQCVDACPADAIDFTQREEVFDMSFGSVVLSTGFDIMDPHNKSLMGYGKYPNVITSPQMDRLLAPTRPFNGVLRPSDGKEPENIAMVLCMGSRDQTVCNPLCCRIGCMYALKHAQLIMGALPLADVTMYYIDIRAFGKGYEEFFQQAKGMGITFVKGKVSRIEETADNNLIVHTEEMSGRGGHSGTEHDLVVLSVGLQPNLGTLDPVKGMNLAIDEFQYIMETDEDINPSMTSVDGIFTAGTVSGSRDIPDTVLHAGAASTLAAGYLQRMRKQHG